jgi:hypothetical protein
MGAMLSTVIYQPLLLGTASTLMIIALIYQDKSSVCGSVDDKWGSNIFKLNMGVSIVVVIAAVIISFISALTI